MEKKEKIYEHPEYQIEYFQLEANPLTLSNGYGGGPIELPDVTFFNEEGWY